MLFGLGLFLLLFVGPAGAIQALAGSDSVRILLKQGRFEVDGLSARDLAELKKANWTKDQWIALLAIRVRGSDPSSEARVPPVLGEYKVDDKGLRFEPRFPLRAGLSYRAVLDLSRIPGRAGKQEPLTIEFFLPRKRIGPPTVVEHVYPTAAQLPENQLKFYLHFSAPMSRGQAYRNIHLREVGGKEVQLPFLEIDEELWDPQTKRLTLFFDPGRIKRGLKPREEVGPALEAGKRYTLLIDRAWLDAQGDPLDKSFRKDFRVGPPDDGPVDPRLWKLRPPTAGATAPVIVRFPKPLDHALLEHMLWIVDSRGDKVPGKVAIGDDETSWSYSPAQAWVPGTFRLVADVDLEDWAGNRIGRPFEIDLFQRVERQLVRSRTVEVPFQVHARKASN
jgi:hypothetical protein